ncbi:MAG TPA: glutathione S-transferase [Betaproteobacteria bacterium]|nr:glutathione S-transferase [Betaproteobacteria bacterium]
MELELVSFKVCPFVQRSVITLLYKHAPFQIRYIDLADPPTWFLELSPSGKVPLLRVDDRAVLFESAVINEYIDEVTPGSLHPADPLRRAQNRAWIEFGASLLMDHFMMLTADSEAKHQACRQDLLDKLARVEAEVGEGPYFNGADFSLIDAAYAPLFMRLDLLNPHLALYTAADYPKIAVWGQALAQMDAVKSSVTDDFNTLYFGHIHSKGGVATQKLPGAG